MLFTYPLTLEIQLNRTKLGYIVWQTFPLHLTNSLTLWRLSMKYISILRGDISGTNNGQTNICFAGAYRHKYLVLGRDKSLKCRKKITDSSRKFSETEIIKMLVFWLTVYSWETFDSGIFPLFVIWHLHHIFISVDLCIGINSSRHFFVLSFRLNRLNVVFFIVSVSNCSDILLSQHPNVPTH